MSARDEFGGLTDDEIAERTELMNRAYEHGEREGYRKALLDADLEPDGDRCPPGTSLVIALIGGAGFWLGALIF